ncbi:DNA-binding protein H-NS [Andreprevotia lacus DSM 23236]|jgi:DNA-binding protein H-NS|uniref:DNA-binding protein H-NS n=1 Tax=Andreprevotia lacus DSM 23236 TaxID=1121001 RepID=A0A1W1Y1D4_9NEIS|nr:H-NS histone family protein [Andreprevotia lacus]SMC29947.1 DNA-binding protein H-NS [Andreprevotia lacus DSM 23236]
MKLSGLTLAALRQLQEDIQVAIAARRQAGCQALLGELNALAAEKGFSLRELLGEPEKPAAPAVKPKGVARYRNPQNGSQTWTGHGRKPQWVIDFLAAGGQLDQLGI